MASTPAKGFVKHVKPLISSNKEDARKAVLKLYKDWCRALPQIVLNYDMPLSYEGGVQKIKSEFLKHKNVNDIRAIDMLILKSRNELFDLRSGIRLLNQTYYKYNANPPPPQKDFLSKFYSGAD